MGRSLSRLVKNPLATTAVVAGLVGLLVGAANFTQPALKICRRNSAEGEIIRDCRCVGVKVDATRTLAGFGELSSDIDRVFECRGLILGLRERSPDSR
jgi:hypothetical protein